MHIPTVLISLALLAFGKVVLPPFSRWLASFIPEGRVKRALLWDSRNPRRVAVEKSVEQHEVKHDDVKG